MTLQRNAKNRSAVRMRIPCASGVTWTDDMIESKVKLKQCTRISKNTIETMIEKEYSKPPYFNLLLINCKSPKNIRRNQTYLAVREKSVLLVSSNRRNATLNMQKNYEKRIKSFATETFETSFFCQVHCASCARLQYINIMRCGKAAISNCISNHDMS